MYCDRCNIDFPEGLRYCKWCGQALARPRTTSELYVCPSCSDAVQPGWAFCKACGVKLRGAERGQSPSACPQCGAGTEPDAASCTRCGADLRRPPVAPQRQPGGGHDTAVIAHCSTCGDHLEPDTIYCKGCGTPTYGSARPFGQSSLLCSVCNSRSPVGSAACRVCGAPLESPAPSTVEASQPGSQPARESHTLPDLGEHLPAAENANQVETASSPDAPSGAHTLVFEPNTGEIVDSASTTAEPNTEAVTSAAGSQPHDGAETTVLHEGAGGHQSPTAHIDKPRTTAPVDESPESTLLGGPTVETAAVDTTQATIDFGSRAEQQRSVGNDSQPPPADAGTAAIGSEAGSALISSEAASPSTHSDARRDWQATAPVTRPAEYAVPDTSSLFAHYQAELANAPAEAEAPAAPTKVSAAVPLPGPAIPRKKSSATIVSVVVVFILLSLAGYFAWWFVSGGARRPAPPPPDIVRPPTEVAPPPSPPTPPPVPDGMVLVQGGTYIIGRSNQDPLEGPEHSVDVAPFFMDRTEVTNAQYKRFVDATSQKPPADWTDGSFPAGRENWPVTNVKWQDAVDYAAWAGKRLPSEVEWEAAARGKDGRIYPWGNDWTPGLANIAARSVTDVGQNKDGASPSGVLDMIGNVWEWTADEFELYPGSTAKPPEIEAGVTYRVIRGGAFDGNRKHDAAYRGFVDAGQGYPKTGFRCVKSAPVSAQ